MIKGDFCDFDFVDFVDPSLHHTTNSLHALRSAPRPRDDAIDDLTSDVGVAGNAREALAQLDDRTTRIVTDLTVMLHGR